MIVSRCRTKRQNYIDNLINSVQPLLPQHFQQDEIEIINMKSQVQQSHDATNKVVSCAQALSLTYEGISP
jgi:hypothetical protein